jgi:hypothetical protein
MSARVIIPTCDRALDEASTNFALRELAYFDEVVTGYVIITKTADEDVAQATVEISVLNKSRSQDMSIKSIQLSSPVRESENEAVFKFEFYSLFPKIKLQDPILKINFKGMLQTKSKVEVANKKERPLPSLRPATRTNMLEGLSFAVTSSDKDSKVVLFDSAIDRSKPSSIKEASYTEITDSIELPILRTLNIRVRNIKLKNISLITTLDIEQSSKSKERDLKIELLRIDFKISQTFKPKFQKDFPIDIDKDGSYSFSYQLIPQAQGFVKNSQVLIEIRYKINSLNQIQTNLFTNIDLSKITQIPSKLSNSSVSVSGTPNLINNSLSNSLSIKFIGNKIVRVGEPFKVRVFISNQSSKDRNLLMVFNSNTIQTTTSFQPDLPKIKSLIHSMPALLDNYSNLRLKTQGILSLVNEVQFKLKPVDTKDGQSVFQNEIELIALEIGVFNLQGVKLLDLTTGETLNCDRLLEIVVEP